MSGARAHEYHRFSLYKALGSVARMSSGIKTWVTQSSLPKGYYYIVSEISDNSAKLMILKQPYALKGSR